MKTKPLNVAVCGLGRMGYNHVRVLRELPDCRIVAIADPVTEKATAMASELDCRSFPSLTLALSETQPDAVFIAAPTEHHYRLGREVLEKAIPLFIEKPIASNPADAQRLVDLSEANNTLLAVGHVERFNPVIASAHQFLQRKVLGDLIHVNVKRVGGTPKDIQGAGDVLVDLAVHDVDILNWLLGADAKLVSCLGHSSRGILDSANLLLQSGAVSIAIHVNWMTPVKLRHIEICGTQGILSIDLITQSMELIHSNHHLRDAASKERLHFEEFLTTFCGVEKTSFDIRKQEPLKEELKAFVACLREKKPFPMQPRAAVEALRIVDEARRLLSPRGTRLKRAG